MSFYTNKKKKNFDSSKYQSQGYFSRILIQVEKGFVI